MIIFFPGKLKNDHFPGNFPEIIEKWSYSREFSREKNGKIPGKSEHLSNIKYENRWIVYHLISPRPWNPPAFPWQWSRFISGHQSIRDRSVTSSTSSVPRGVFWTNISRPIRSRFVTSSTSSEGICTHLHTPGIYLVIANHTSPMGNGDSESIRV